ncbi:histidine kinase [Sulfurimonas lithotrophica]|uniref:histidine kinase n=1 Tax=Sulfurimonas lithotrophica TaxID=2590022 RepID=A0A5P8P3A2_9BACT|nr:cache domain-containing protein [Sulfurimonas lithotrophica]QFR50020.1 histidine kinase [Sulfurimonas lithotrophica]
MSKKYNFFDKTKLIPNLIIVIPMSLVLVVSFFIGTFYIDKVEEYFEQARKNSISEYITNKKNESEVWVSQLDSLFKYKSDTIDSSIKKELKTRVDLAYESAKHIYEKYRKTNSEKDIKNRIKDALSKMYFNEKKNYIFITSFNGKSVLSGSREFENKNIMNYSDSDGRAIVLEEITKVKKNKEGFIKTNYYKGGGVKTIYVKDLGFYDWYIGSSIFDMQQLELAKQNSLDIIRSTPIQQNNFLAIYENKKPIYLSHKMRELLGNEPLQKVEDSLSKKPQWYEQNINGHIYYSTYIESFDWHIIYGFNISKMSKSELEKQEKIQILLNKEVDFITKITAIIVVLVVFLSIIFSRTINKIFLSYQDEVKLRQRQLELLNASLEQKVARELHNLRQKDKMLIQQSKMADMGDMLSMIAHQWRQPLNQLSYIFMNIDSAYEYKELNKKYLDEKIKEGNHLLEFMSETIDDFRDYFKPDQKKELTNIGDVVKRGLELMKKPLENAHIEIVHINKCEKDIEIYVNEFVQVVLNLVKNAKDALFQNNITEPKIKIITKCSQRGTFVEVRDNGGGIDAKIMDQIFEPYFTTKDAKQGTGLGLYMSKMIVEEHLGGKIIVQNIDGGASFKIVL